MFKLLKSLLSKKLPSFTCNCSCGVQDTLNVTYSPFNCPLSGSTAIQGIRGINGSEDVYVSGSLEVDAASVLGLIYKGPLSHNGSLGKWYTFTYADGNVSDTYNTSCYGPCDIGNGNIRFVGSYKTTSSGNSALGMLYEGALDGSGTYTTIAPNGGNTLNVYVHSTMGDLAVGNYDTELTNGNAFIYDIVNKTYNDLKIPNDTPLTTTLYGVWHNGGTQYTMVGGFSKKEIIEAQQAFICDYDSKTQVVSNFTRYNGKNQIIKSFITHFEGINASCNGYDLAAGFANVEGGGSSYVRVMRKEDGTFSRGVWTDIKYPDNAVKITTSDTVYKKNILGIIVTKDGISAYLAKLNK